MGSEGEVVDEIAALLDQCSPDELDNILKTIDGDLYAEPIGQSPETAASTPQVVPPTGPPPSGGRRPAPVGLRRTENTSESKSVEQEEEPMISMSEAKQLLDEHSANLMEEVRKTLPYLGAVRTMEGGVDMEMLTNVLAMRDQEVKELEAELAQLQTKLSSKDRRVFDLSGELDVALREVRHRQLDLEFQHLKLEERIRSNAELDQKQKGLLMRVEEAGLNARHAALDIEMGRTASGASAVRLQGSLPWTVRKSRPVANAFA